MANLVQAGIDPITALANSEFAISVTPDLATEYQQGIDSDNTTAAEKDLCRRLLAAAPERGIFGFAGPDGSSGGHSGFDHGYWADEGAIETLQSVKVTERPGKAIPKNRTDAFLVALAGGAVVVTNDTGKHFRLAREKGHHVYSWAELVDVGNPTTVIARRLGLLLAPLAVF
ncbi:hypothetical protein [Burkholderia ambifaria]|uniref:hypothetical protein n=1 Tax=Burkholderia ambifaria TaxID=152480 RepID=UPI002FE15245